MAEVTAKQKFSCPACGGEAEWNPAKSALVCPYCGVTSPAEVSMAPDGSTVIHEHDLAFALRSVPDDQRGWQIQRTSVRCQSCQAISVLEAEKVSQACDFCGATALVPEHEQKQPFRPESLLPMKVTEGEARDALRSWLKSRFWAPSDLGKKAMTDRVRGLYIPYWTFDAQARAAWTAESGTYYYVTQNVGGKPKRVRMTRWSHASGNVEHFFDDQLIAASRGVHGPLLHEVEPFDTTRLAPYSAHFLSGWVVERYQIDLIAAAASSRARMDEALRGLCGSQVPGDTYRNLQVSANYSGQTFKHVLVPLWLLSYRYGKKSFQAAVNGDSGRVAGEHPLSWVKITLAVLLALAVVGVLLWSQAK
jgi:hypothetical protein